MSTPVADIVALAGDPNLDCHLTGLRLTSVISPEHSDYDAEGILLFDTTQASGWWIDSNGGGRVQVDTVTELIVTFGITMQPGFEPLAHFMTARLESWADSGVHIELTSAPGKWTLLRSPADTVPIPRRSESGALR